MNKIQAAAKSSARQNARELTAEIDRMTDLAARQDLEEGILPSARRGAEGAYMGVEQQRWMPGSGQYDDTRKLGSAIISSGDLTMGVTGERPQNVGERAMNLGEAPGVNRNEALRGVAELAKDVTEVVNPESTVGVETKVQRKEYRSEDLEELEHENGQGLKFEAKIVKQGQEAVAEEYRQRVDTLIAQPSFALNELVKTYREGVNAAMKVFNRTIGGRN